MARTRHPAHLAKNFSTQLFSAFVIDLGRFTEKGITDEQCSANVDWLREMSALYVVLGDDFFGKRIFQRCDEVAREYDEWNSPEGTPKTRRVQYERIKRKVNKLAGSYRRRIEMIRQNADIDVYIAIYAAAERLILAFPGLLRTVAEVILKFPRGGRGRDEGDD